MKPKETTGNLTILPINPDTFIDRMLEAPAEEVPPYGLFHLSFNNKRRQGKHGLRTCYCQGALYETGRVHLDTNELPAQSFDTLTDMQDYLEQFGAFHISWMRGE